MTSARSAAPSLREKGLFALRYVLRPNDDVVDLVSAAMETSSISGAATALATATTLVARCGLPSSPSAPSPEVPDPMVDRPCVIASGPYGKLLGAIEGRLRVWAAHPDSGENVSQADAFEYALRPDLPHPAGETWPGPVLRTGRGRATAAHRPDRVPSGADPPLRVVVGMLRAQRGEPALPREFFFGRQIELSMPTFDDLGLARGAEPVRDEVAELAPRSPSRPKVVWSSGHRTVAGALIRGRPVPAPQSERLLSSLVTL